MDGAVNAATAEQRGVGSIHDGIGLLASDVTGTGDDKDTLVQLNSHSFA